jgi:hypothetical protein
LRNGLSIKKWLVERNRRATPNAFVIPNAASFFAGEEPVLSEAEGISVCSTAARQPNVWRLYIGSQPAT